MAQRIDGQRVREVARGASPDAFPEAEVAAAARARRRPGPFDRLSGAGGSRRQRVAGDGAVRGRTTSSVA